MLIFDIQVINLQYSVQVWSRWFIEWRLWNALVSINNTPHWIRIYFRQYISNQ